MNSYSLCETVSAALDPESFSASRSNDLMTTKEMWRKWGRGTPFQPSSWEAETGMLQANLIYKVSSRQVRAA